MTSNKAYILLLLAAVAAGMSSCTFKDDDVFGQNPTDRINRECSDIRTELAAASQEGGYGWVMQHFAAGVDGNKYSGFNMLVAFDTNGKVRFASDHGFLRNGKAGIYTESTSLYDIIQEDGPVLSFNSWNDVFSVIADPVDPSKAPGYIENDGVGMASDNNLVVMSHSSSEVILRGQRFSAPTRLIRCDRPWKQYLQDVGAMKERIAGDGIELWYMTDGQDTLEVSQLASGVMVIGGQYIDAANNQKSPFVFTPLGLRLGSGINFDKLAGKDSEHLCQEFCVNEDKTALVSADGSISMVTQWEKCTLDRTLWFIDNATLSDEQREWCQNIETEVIKSFPTFTLRGLALGKTPGKDAIVGLSLVFYKSSSRLSCMCAGLSLDKKNTSQHVAQLSVPAEEQTDYNMNVLRKSLTNKSLPVFNNNLAALMNSFSGTFTMQPDDYFSPTAITLTAEDGHVYSVAKDNNKIVIE